MDRTPVILIVDDHPKNVKLLEAHLATTGFITATACDGEQALDMVREVSPDLVLLDVMMPKIDGFEVCRRLKSDEKTRLIPIVMVTALDNLEDKVRGIESGADDFLTKPVNRIELLARTRALVKTKQLNDQVLNLQSVLGSLLEISTFRQRFSDRHLLFSEFTERAAQLTLAQSVAITLWDRGDIVVEASHNLTDEIWQQNHTDGTNAVQYVMENGQMLTVRMEDQELQRKYGLYTSYVGVPFVSFSGKTYGAIHTFGVPDTLSKEAMRMLIIIAQRMGYELQLKDYNTRLEGEVDLRTGELKRAMSELQVVNRELSQAQSETIFRLAKAAEYRDEDTAAHLHRMSNYAYAVARHMDLDSDFAQMIKLSATMHDVGKIGTPDAILLKSGRLTPDEYEIMKDHTLIGARILGGSKSEVLRMSEKIALTHHEKYDGSGYPRRMSGDSIPIEGRIVAIADVFDALTTKRVYKRAFSIDESLSILKRDAGTHFDPLIFSAFLRAFDEILEIRNRYPELETDSD
jgi:response regulator RpfG family c-di-GMP phosphodiesterase